VVPLRRLHRIGKSLEHLPRTRPCRSGRLAQSPSAPPFFPSGAPTIAPALLPAIYNPPQVEPMNSRSSSCNHGSIRPRFCVLLEFPPQPAPVFRHPVHRCDTAHDSPISKAFRTPSQSSPRARLPRARVKSPRFLLTAVRYSRWIAAPWMDAPPPSQPPQRKHGSRDKSPAALPMARQQLPLPARGFLTTARQHQRRHAAFPAAWQTATCCIANADVGTDGNSFGFACGAARVFTTGRRCIVSTLLQLGKTNHSRWRESEIPGEMNGPSLFIANFPRARKNLPASTGTPVCPGAAAPRAMNGEAIVLVGSRNCVPAEVRWLFFL